MDDFEESPKNDDIFNHNPDKVQEVNNEDPFSSGKSDETDRIASNPENPEENADVIIIKNAVDPQNTDQNTPNNPNSSKTQEQNYPIVPVSSTDQNNQIVSSDQSNVINDIDSDKSTSTSELNFYNIRKIFNDDDTEESDEYESKIHKLYRKYKLPFISSAITLLLIIITIGVASGVKTENRLHIVTRTLEIVDNRGGFLMWALHCIGLFLLPWLFFFLFADCHIVFIFMSPVMMFLNMLGGFLPIKGSCYPLIIEVLFCIFLLFKLPFRSVYCWGTSKFWLGEVTLMTLAFVYISCALGASTLSYMLFARYIRINRELALYPSNPYYAIEYLNLLDMDGHIRVNGSYLACYSLFTFFAVGIGFLMSFRNSFLMSVPFLVLAICTVIETHGIGILLFFQLLFHLLYIFGLNFQKTRKITVGCCNCCFESCNATLTTIILGDLIGFLLIVFPILGIVLDGSRENWPWGWFILSSLLIMVGVIFHFLIAFSPDSIWRVIVAPLFLTGAVYVVGFGFQGYVPFIRAFTYEVTYLAWSFSLSFWSWANGFSPVLFKTYNALVALASLIIIEVYEGIGWMEIIFAIVQIFFDTYMIVYIQKIKAKYIGWAVFSVSGIAFLGFIAGAVVVIGGLVVMLVLSFIGKCCEGSSSYSNAMNYLRNNPNLKPGDTFECDGQIWRVTYG